MEIDAKLDNIIQLLQNIESRITKIEENMKIVETDC